MAENELSTPLENTEPTRHDVLTEAFNAVEEAAPAETKPVIERPRKDDGKFAEGKVKVVAAKPTEPTEPAEVPVWKKAAPLSWKKDYHEVWPNLDPRAQEYIHQREEQMKAGVEPLKSKAQFADSIQQVIEPYSNLMKGLGVDAPTVIKEFFNADHILRNSPQQEKLAYLVKLAQNYGVDLRGLTGQALQAPPVDQNYQAVMNELNKVRGQVLTWQEQQENAQNQVLMSDIQKFAQSHEHFETIKPYMISLLQSGHAETLDEAYKKAIRLDDGLYESQVNAAKQAEITDKDKAAKKARSAAVSVRSSTPGTHTTPKANTRREVLEEQFSGIDSRL